MRVACQAGRRRATRPGGVCRALAVAGLVLGAAGIGWADTPRRILLLYPESFYRPAVVAFDTTFRFKVRARYPGMVYFDMEKVGPRVCTDAAAYEAFQTLLKIQYAQTPPDIIVASVPEMFGSFANRARTLFPEAAGMLLGVIPEARMAFTGGYKHLQNRLGHGCQTDDRDGSASPPRYRARGGSVRLQSDGQGLFGKNAARHRRFP